MSFYIRKQIHVYCTMTIIEYHCAFNYYTSDCLILAQSLQLQSMSFSVSRNCDVENKCASKNAINKTSGSGAPLHSPLHVESYPFTISQFVKSIQHTFYTHLEQSWLDHCPKSVRMGPLLLTAEHNSKMNVSQGSMIPSTLLLYCFRDSLKGKKTDIHQPSIKIT